MGNAVAFALPIPPVLPGEGCAFPHESSIPRTSAPSRISNGERDGLALLIG
jgi:hypothetical protein